MNLINRITYKTNTTIKKILVCSADLFVSSAHLVSSVIIEFNFSIEAVSSSVILNILSVVTVLNWSILFNSFPVSKSTTLIFSILS